MPIPEKDFFTLEEIMARWRFSGCDLTTLLDYARRDLLVFAVYLRDLGSHARTRETDKGTVTTTTTFSFTSPGYVAEPIKYLTANDARRTLECRPNEIAAVSVLYSSRDRTKETGTGYLQAHYLTPNDLVVTREERDRFEKEHKVNLTSNRLASAWAWFADSTNQKALAILGSALGSITAAAWIGYTWWVGKGGSP